MSTVENAAPEEPSYTREGPSKSRRKADAHALQTLGAELVALNRAQLAQVEMPEALRDAVEAAQRISAHEGRRRQLQFIGKLMRYVDPAPIRAKIAGWKTVSVEETARLHLIERWRDRLLEDPSSVQMLVDEYPQVAFQQWQQLRTLIRNTQHEREQAKPPKNYRVMFQLLREIISA